jgi:hypothetical protein
MTMDQGLEYQQHLAGATLAIVVLVARSNRFGDLWPLVPEVLRALDDVAPGRITRVGR